ncbi:hypothetical protein [Methylobacterium hispanicum]|uniref:hypothetical protein n=1 Tax=Methylobacterium hispanicum TaxID=270350 RepID=UPI002F2EF553
MRRLLTGGIKAILAIAALSTAAHWALRVQREQPTAVARATAIPEPTTTGSIAPREAERRRRRGEHPRPAGGTAERRMRYAARAVQLSPGAAAGAGRMSKIRSSISDPTMIRTDSDAFCYVRLKFSLDAYGGLDCIATPNGETGLSVCGDLNRPEGGTSRHDRT